MYFVDHCHQNGIGVILDWVPAHFPRDGTACGCSTARASTSMPTRARASTRDWGTLIFNYGRQRSAQLPALERLVLARQISHRRPAR